MKKLLPILYAEDRPTLHLLKEAADRAGFIPHLVHLSAIEIRLGEGGPEVILKGIPLKKFPIVFVREVRDYVNEMSLVTKYCFHKKIPIVDSVFLEARGAGGKLGLMTNHAMHRLPLPRTFFSQNGADIKAITDGLSFPIVAKDNRGRHGRNVFLLKNFREFKSFYEKLSRRRKTLASKIYFFQEFIPADSDMRVLVLGGEVIGAIERKTARKGEFRHNVALGSNAKQIPVTEEMKRLALESSRILSYEFAGVDLIRNRETGKLYVLEVNRSPEFEGFIDATGIDVPEKVMQFLQKMVPSRPKVKLRFDAGSGGSGLRK